MDSTQKFNGLAGDYMIGRPAYATEFIEYLYTKHGFSAQSIIADIGSGTGKFAKQLLNKDIRSIVRILKDLVAVYKKMILE